MKIEEAIAQLVKGLDLSEGQMTEVMEQIAAGTATPAQIGSFLTALRMKGETVDEITGAVRVLRQRLRPIATADEHTIDTCGTGGDEAMTFNISTAAAFVAAGCGIKVAKHGNRSVSSRSGSADVLKALGVNIEAEANLVEECIEQVGIGFLFAPLLHGAMKYATPVRREIGIRTIFNMLGPLSNPAGTKYQLIGVYDDLLTDIFAKVLARLGTKHALVVHGEDGLDEITLTTRTKVTELKDGSIRTYHIEPEQFGFSRCSSMELKGGSAEQNAEIILDILTGKRGPKRDVVVLNAAAAIVVGGRASTLAEGIKAAEESIDSGRALEKLQALREKTQG